MIVLRSSTFLILTILAFAAGFFTDAAIGVRAHLHDRKD